MSFLIANIDGYVGIGVFGMLALLGIDLIRRTKDVDERRDEMVEIAMDLALEREGRANADRDRALLELAEVRKELEEARDEMEVIRAEWDAERRRLAERQGE